MVFIWQATIQPHSFRGRDKCSLSCYHRVGYTLFPFLVIVCISVILVCDSLNSHRVHWFIPQIQNPKYCTLSPRKWLSNDKPFNIKLFVRRITTLAFCLPFLKDTPTKLKDNTSSWVTSPRRVEIHYDPKQHHLSIQLTKQSIHWS